MPEMRLQTRSSRAFIIQAIAIVHNRQETRAKIKQKKRKEKICRLWCWLGWVESFLFEKKTNKQTTKKRQTTRQKNADTQNN